MKREIDSRIEWDEEGKRLEFLDYSNPSDLQELLKHVETRLNKHLDIYGIDLGDHFMHEELIDHTRRAAVQFEEKHISLPLFIYLKLRLFVDSRLVEKGFKVDWRNKKN